MSTSSNNSSCNINSSKTETTTAHNVIYDDQFGNDNNVSIKKNAIDKKKIVKNSDNSSIPLSKWPIFMHRTRRESTSLVFHEPFVSNGYRPANYPLKYYLFSLFQLHNETMNVWTHLLAVFGVIYKGFYIYNDGEIDFFNDPHSWPIVACLFSAAFLYLSSFAAHLIHSKSEILHYILYMVDFSGVGLYGLGSTLLHVYLISDETFFQRWHHWYPLFGILLSLATMICCSLSKILYVRPYPLRKKFWQIIPVALMYIVLIAPVIDRLYNCKSSIYGGNSNNSNVRNNSNHTYLNSCMAAESNHKQQIFYFILSGLFFTIDFPQRIYNGLCNYFMHSHSIFHIAISMCSFKQFDAVHVEFLNRFHELHRRPTPSFFSAFGPLCLVIFAEITCIFLFRIYVRNKLKKNK